MHTVKRLPFLGPDRLLERVQVPSIDQALYRRLEQRVGRHHLNQRLGIERDFEAKIFGQGRNFFHIENWYSMHALIRNVLRVLGLHRQGKRNARAVKIRHNEITVASLPSAFDGYTLLQVTDLHLDMADDIPCVLIDAIHRVSYDACVLTGDFRAKTFGPYEPALKALRQVRSHLRSPIYGILGNHDSICMVPEMEAMGIRMLLNESVALRLDDEAIYLAGIDDPHYYRADNLEKAVSCIPDAAFSILLSHSPEMYRHAAYAGFDVMLSGHTHGGQICLPGRIPLMVNARAPRSICNGAWRYNQLCGYTSAGSGVSIVDVRLNCPPEITLHRLRCA